MSCAIPPWRLAVLNKFEHYVNLIQIPTICSQARSQGAARRQLAPLSRHPRCLPLPQGMCPPRTRPTGSAHETREFTGFISYVLKENHEPDQLRKWFAKPKPEEVADTLPTTAPTYAEVPEELKRRTLLRSAESYHKHDDGRRRPSKWLINILAALFFIPASLVYAFSCTWHALFPVRLFSLILRAAGSHDAPI